MNEQIREAMAEYLSGNRGKPDYGIDIENVAKDGSKFDLILTFKKGAEYCCMEPGCHLPFGFDDSQRSWKEFREILKLKGVEPAGPIQMRMTGVIEEGSVMKIELRKTPGFQRFVTEKTKRYSDGLYTETI
jgi:hypothetical protein